MTSRPSAPAVPLLAALLLAPVAAGAQEFPVRETTLANGMKVLVHEDHSIPSVALFIFYRVGSRDEHTGITGISHFFEHMMFNGAKKYGPKQLDVVMEAAGGRNNAYTDYDVTVYQDWFPPSALDLILDIEADRIEHLAFDPKMIESERGVVASERRTSVEANNYAVLDEELWAAAYTAHPYQWPVIGWMTDIQAWTLDDLKHHFRMGYSPSNATLVVAGDIAYDDFVRLARAKLERIPAHDPPPPVLTQEPEQKGERRIAVERLAQLPILEVGYHVPASSHADFYPLQVLRNVLFFGQSSRMYRRLVDRDQLAVDVDAAMGLALDPTLLTMTVQPREGVAPATVERALDEEIDALRRDGVRPEELAKAKNALLAAFYRNMRTISGKAQAIGSYQVYFGDYKRLFAAADEYGKVTSADVVAAASRYLTARNRTVAVLVPSADAGASGEGEEGDGEAAVASPAPSPKPTPSPSATATPAPPTPTPTQTPMQIPAPLPATESAPAREPVAITPEAAADGATRPSGATEPPPQKPTPSPSPRRRVSSPDAGGVP